MKNIEKKFKGSQGISKARTIEIEGEDILPYCSFRYHPGVLSEARIEYKGCLDCKYFRIYKTREKQ